MDLVKKDFMDDTVRKVSYCLDICMHASRIIRMYVRMYDYMYCLYVDFDYAYTKSFLGSRVWLQAVAGARTYGTDSLAIPNQPR